MFQPTEGLGIDDTVTVALEAGSYGAWLFPLQPATTELTLSGIRGKSLFLLLCLFTYIRFVNHGIAVIIAS
jgi:hypothetical protein